RFAALVEHVGDVEVGVGRVHSGQGEADQSHAVAAVEQLGGVGEVCGWGAGVDAFEVEFGRVGGLQLRGRGGVAAALGVPGDAHRSVVGQVGLVQLLGGADGVEHRVPLGDPVDVGVHAGGAQPLVVGDDHGVPPGQQPGDEGALVLQSGGQRFRGSAVVAH